MTTLPTVHSSPGSCGTLSVRELSPRLFAKISIGKVVHLSEAPSAVHRGTRAVTTFARERRSVVLKGTRESDKSEGRRDASLLASRYFQALLMQCC